MTSVSTHILDTSRGRPAAGVAVALSVRTGPDAPWTAHAASVTDADGRCKDLAAVPDAATHVRLDFAVEPYLAGHATPHADHQAPAADPLPAGDRPTTAHQAHAAHTTHATHATHQAEAQQDAPRSRDSGRVAFFPEVAVVFAVTPGEHFHVPLLLNPFGYSVYRGS